MEKDVKVPIYSKTEENINITTHFIGVIIGVISLIAMLTLSIKNKSVSDIIGASVFGGSLIWLYTMSTLYHKEKDIEKRKIGQKFDHLSINILISGSLTLFMVAGLANTTGYILTAISWSLSLISMVLNSINVKKFRAASMVIYILTGWAPIFVVKQLLVALGWGGFGMLLAGGLFYTFGLIFYSMKKQYMHSIWHVFVLSGSICHIIAAIVWVL